MVIMAAVAMLVKAVATAVVAESQPMQNNQA
jgi:hypothetical protein